MVTSSKVQAKQRLQNALNEIPGLMQVPYSSPEFDRWKRNTEIAIENTFPNNGRHIDDFKAAVSPPRIYTGYFTHEQEQGSYVANLERVQPILQSMIDEIEEYWPDEDLPQGHSGLSHFDVGKRETGKAFVAMWFNDEMNDAYDNGIEPALMSLGYEPVRIDKILSTDDIMGEILAQISECDIMIADFTHGKEGPRGGVYYEAGYAEALGKSVIMCCREDQSPDIHFDTNHKFHIMWKTSKDLRDALRSRIPARLAARQVTNERQR